MGKSRNLGICNYFSFKNLNYWKQDITENVTTLTFLLQQMGEKPSFRCHT